MAISGFEGFEKRLELHFFGDDPAQKSPITGPIGLRQIDFDSLQQVLQEVQCTVVSALANNHFDSYVLSESSLFVYPNKIIIKTCGTTQLLKSVRPMVHLAAKLGLSLSSLRYTRGEFIFPESQPFPHTSFEDEVFYLRNALPESLIHQKATVMNTWHVFTASVVELEVSDEDHFTVEICMTELDSAAAARFFRRENDGKNGDSAGKEMTELAGIGKIIPTATICDYAFDPCGYSMNGVDRDRYSTIHVTPEDGFSYASYETVFPGGDSAAEEEEVGKDLARVVRSVERVFRPAKMTVAVTGGGEIAWRRVAGALESVGMKRRSCVADEFPVAGDVVYQTFATRRR